MTLPEHTSPDRHGPFLFMLWQQAATGKDFVEAAMKAGYRVAKWPYQRPFRVITPDGENLDLVRALNPQATNKQGLTDKTNNRFSITTAAVKVRLRSVWQQLPSLKKE